MKNISIGKATIEQLEQELSNRKSSKLVELQKQRIKLDQEIKNLTSNQKVGIIKKSMKRLNNDKSLESRIMDIVSDKQTRSPNQLLDALTSSGWKTKSGNPYAIVAAALLKLEKKNVLTRVSRGNYQLL